MSQNNKTLPGLLHTAASQVWPGRHVTATQTLLPWCLIPALWAWHVFQYSTYMVLSEQNKTETKQKKAVRDYIMHQKRSDDLKDHRVKDKLLHLQPLETQVTLWSEDWIIRFFMFLVKSLSPNMIKNQHQNQTCAHKPTHYTRSSTEHTSTLGWYTVYFLLGQRLLRYSTTAIKHTSHEKCVLRLCGLSTSSCTPPVNYRAAAWQRRCVTSEMPGCHMSALRDCAGTFTQLGRSQW